MHELSISSAVVETAIAHCGGRRVSVVSVRVGHLRQVVPDSLRFYFEIVAARDRSWRARGSSWRSCPRGCAARTASTSGP